MACSKLSLLTWTSTMERLGSEDPALECWEVGEGGGARGVGMQAPWGMEWVGRAWLVAAAIMAAVVGERRQVGGKVRKLAWEES